MDTRTAMHAGTVTLEHEVRDLRDLQTDNLAADIAEVDLGTTDAAVLHQLYQLAEQHLSKPSVRIHLFLKRLMDITVGSFLILLLLPVLVVAALATWLSSPGPVLFSHSRWARWEKHFKCLKFRSMHVDHDQHLNKEKVAELALKGILFKHERDPRITAVGGILRKTSIDELPQLFNVLKGDMGLVGPRPLVTYMLEPFPALRRIRGLVRPGITGLWQVNDRPNNLSALQMQKYDIEYVMNVSIWLDLKILLQTPAAVFRGDGAH
jgi:lipopolysaccharide/colanic/teichoic acid biosynthesis glycosyltransferase